MAEEIKKMYAGITDLQMLGEAQTIKNLFVEDLADFTAFDADLDAAFGTALQGKIDAAYAIPTDETVVDEISELTEAVDTAWDACKTHFQDAKYFISKAFPGQVSRHNVFGFDNYAEMSRSQKEVHSFMKTFHTAAVKYDTELIAAGYTQVKIDAIATLAASFDEANNDQETAKKHRPVITQARITAMNEVWKGLKTINVASKSVYRTDYAKLQQYLMPAPASNEPPEALSLRGTIINTVTNLPEPGVAVALPDLGLATTADLTGSFGFAAGAPAGITALTAVKAGFASYEANVTLVEGTTVVWNFQMTPE